MRLLLLTFSLLLTMNMQAQSYKKFVDEDTKDIIYKGKVTFNDLQQEQAFDWYTKGVKNYTPGKDVISELSAALETYDVKLTVFMGTWCEDSHNLVPKLAKVLQQCKYPASSVKMFGLDLSKKGLNNEEASHNIEYVPTIILTHKGKEIGRIVETVDESLEIDMLRIIIDYTSDEIDY